VLTKLLDDDGDGTPFITSANVFVVVMVLDRRVEVLLTIRTVMTMTTTTTTITAMICFRKADIVGEKSLGSFVGFGRTVVYRQALCASVEDDTTAGGTMGSKF
jgi:hypothetical protein